MRCDEPSRDCPLCPRLVDFRLQTRSQFPDWHNAPVPSFGDVNARLLIVGLAPGLRGANRTGRPFTGDYAGRLLYDTLLAYGFAAGSYEERADDGLRLQDCLISNAVRCVPPANKPEPAEIATCRAFLSATIAALPRLRAILVLGRIAHDSALRALGCKLSTYPFAHGAVHHTPQGYALFDSYHCSRYNTNTGQLTVQMFNTVFGSARLHLDSLQGNSAGEHETFKRVSI